MGIICGLTIDPASAPVGIVFGLLIGVSSYIYVIRSGGW